MHLPGGTEEKYDILSQDSQCRDQNLNRAPYE
jgi:hypothetical protein